MLNVIFETDNGPVAIASEILKKYNLKESKEESYKKLKQGKDSNTVILVKETKSLVLNKISEEEFIVNLEKKLETDKETAKKILKDVQDKLISIAKVITVKEEEDQKEKPILATPIKPPIGLEEIEKEKVDEVKIKKPSIPEIPKLTEKPTKKESEKPIKKEIKKSDIYREPIK